MLITLMGSPFLKNVQYLRHKRRISQKEMARHMGISLYYYRERFEKHKEYYAVFSDDELHSLCDIFLVSPQMMIELDMEQFDADKTPAP